MILRTTKLNKSSLYVLLSLTCIIGKISSQVTTTPTPCPIENFLGSTIEVVAFESCWKIEFFEGGGVYKDTSTSTDCTNNAFSTTPKSLFNASKSTGNLATYDITPNVGYDGELLLLEDPTLPTNDIQTQMTEKPPNSPIFGSYGLTVTFQTCPTPSPSSLPSVLPISTPSITPSDTPSLHPSNAPSSEPSGAPSNAPSLLPSVSPTGTCPISEFTGRSFFLPLLGACFKMEIFDGGNIYVDENNGDCKNPMFDTPNLISYYGGTDDGNKATFINNGNPGKWSGELFVVQGDTDSIEVSDLSIGQRQFQVLQKMTKCVAAPSMSPSILPTDLPSHSSIPSMFPTRDPSTNPSSIPSTNPSTQPSNIRSSLPSLHPSALHPSACPSDGFLGRTFKSVVYNQCWIFESFPGGKMKVDPTDSTCSKTTPDSSTYVLSRYKQGMSNKVFFEKIPGATGSSWEGYIQIIEDVELTQESLELTKLGWTSNEFASLLRVPTCSSRKYSLSPSLKPSSKPNRRPSSNLRGNSSMPSSPVSSIRRFFPDLPNDGQFEVITEVSLNVGASDDFIISMNLQSIENGEKNTSASFLMFGDHLIFNSNNFVVEDDLHGSGSAESTEDTPSTFGIDDNNDLFDFTITHVDRSFTYAVNDQVVSGPMVIDFSVPLTSMAFRPWHGDWRVFNWEIKHL